MTLKSSSALPLPVLTALVIMMLISAAQNYELVFNKYRTLFASSAWNTSELGRVVHGFSDSIGSAEQAWVIAYPHWVDTRLVGINAGFPTRDFGIWPKNLASTLSEKRTQIFLVKPDDSEGLSALVNLYPSGALQLFHSAVKDKDFYIFLVPGEGNTAGASGIGN